MLLGSRCLLLVVAVAVSASVARLEAIGVAFAKNAAPRAAAVASLLVPCRCLCYGRSDQPKSSPFFCPKTNIIFSFWTSARQIAPLANALSSCSSTPLQHSGTALGNFNRTLRPHS